MVLFEKKSKFLLFINLLKINFVVDGLKKQSFKNALFDYSQLLKSSDNELWELHKNMEQIREDIKKTSTLL